MTPDELDDPDDLALGCEVNGEVRQQARSADMIFGVAELVSYLSGVVTLYPGDVIFTGTPPGVGMGRTPPIFLHAGDHLHSWIEGIGELDQTFVARDLTPHPPLRSQSVQPATNRSRSVECDRVGPTRASRRQRSAEGMNER